jgi:hypothetical protein
LVASLSTAFAAAKPSQDRVTSHTSAPITALAAPRGTSALRFADECSSEGNQAANKACSSEDLKVAGPAC